MTADISELNMIRDSARALASRFDLEYWRQHDTKGEYPTDFIQAFAEGGWLGSMIPEEYGGLGLGLTAAGVMLQEVGTIGGANGASAIHFYIFPPGPVIRHGSEEMKRKYLPDIATGKGLMCFGVTEPNAGVDTSRIRTKAERRPGGGWVVNGQKVWITNAQRATRILLLARTSPRTDQRPMDGMTLFFTAMDRTKITVKPIEKLGRNAIDTNELFIENLEISDDEVVGEVGRGFYYLLDGLNPERICVAFEQIGLGRKALELATKYANERVVFDRPIGKNQAVAHPLADSWMRLHAAQLVAMEAAQLYDAKQPCGPEANAAKFLGSEAGFEACDRAMQTFGGFCYAKEYHIERFWRESRLLKIAPVSQEMVLNYISQKVLGLPKSY
jgi:acyl-CoA dehydrogenase